VWELRRSPSDKGGGFSTAVHIQLAQDVGDVVLHSLVTEVEFGADLAVGLARRDEQQDLVLGFGKLRFFGLDRRNAA
jgi:hypothetical protein